MRTVSPLLIAERARMPRMAAGPHSLRTYHRSLSKQMISDSRYSESGTTHMNGSTEMSWQTWLVIAISVVVPRAASRIQLAARQAVGGGESRAAGWANAGRIVSGS